MARKIGLSLDFSALVWPFDKHRTMSTHCTSRTSLLLKPMGFQGLSALHGHSNTRAWTHGGVPDLNIFFNSAEPSSSCVRLSPSDFESVENRVRFQRRGITRFTSRRPVLHPTSSCQWSASLTSPPPVLPLPYRCLFFLSLAGRSPSELKGGNAAATTLPADA
jgi:hypothetical protein